MNSGIITRWREPGDRASVSFSNTPYRPKVILIICRYSGVQLLHPRDKNPRQVAHAQGPRYSTCHGFCPPFAALHSSRFSVCMATAQKPAHHAAGRPPPLGAPPAVPPPPLSNDWPFAALRAINKVPGAFAPPSGRGSRTRPHATAPLPA